MKAILLLTIVASAVAAFGTFVLPRATSVEPHVVTTESARLVLASVDPPDDGSSCSRKYDRGVRTTVRVDRDA
jgi:hypothetical protein